MAKSNLFCALLILLCFEFETLAQEKTFNGLTAAQVEEMKRAYGYPATAQSVARVDYKGKRGGDGLDNALMSANAKAKADHLNGIFKEYESYVKAQAVKQSMAVSGSAVIEENMRQGAELDSNVHVEDWMGEPNSKYVNTSDKQSDKMDLRGMFGQSRADKSAAKGPDTKSTKAPESKQEKSLSGKELWEMNIKNPTPQQKSLILDYLKTKNNNEYESY